MTKRNTVVYIILLCLLAGCVLLSTRPKDHLVLEPVVADLTDTQTEAAVAAELNPDEPYNAIVASEAFNLEQPGRYLLELSYTAEANSAFAELRSGYVASGENDPFTYYDQRLLPASDGSGQLVIELEITEAARGLVLRVRHVQGAFALTSLAVRSTAAVYTDAIFLALLVLAGGLVVLWLWRRAAASPRLRGIPEGGDAWPGNHVSALICLGIALIATLPAMLDFLPVGHDLVVQLARIEGIYEGLMDGQFPVRISPPFFRGHGYIIPVMYPETLLYPAALLRFCGVSLLTSWHTLYLFTNIATALLCWWCCAKLFKSNMAGLLVSGAYTLSLYRLVNLYTRAAIGEGMAMIFLPCIALGIYEVVRGDTRQWKWLVIGMLGVLHTHILTFELAVVGCAILCLFSLRAVLQKTRLWVLARSTALVVQLSAGFLGPFLLASTSDMRVFLPRTIIHRHAVFPIQLFATFVPAEGISQYLEQTIGEMPQSVGGILGLGAILYLFGRFVLKRSFASRHRLMERAGTVGLWGAGVLMVMASTIFPWETVAKIPVIGFALTALQFPWRYLGFASFLLCLVYMAAVMRFDDNGKRRPWLLLCGLLAVLVAASPYMDETIQGYYDEEMSSKHDTVYMIHAAEGLYLSSAVVPDQLTYGDPRLASDVDIQIHNYKKSGTHITFEYENPTGAAADVRVPLVYYTGYGAEWSSLDGTAAETVANGTELLVAQVETQLLCVNIPAGTTSGRVSISWRAPWYYRASEAVSWATLLGLCVWGLVAWRRRRRGQPQTTGAAS